MKGLVWTSVVAGRENQLPMIDENQLPMADGELAHKRKPNLML